MGIKRVTGSPSNSDESNSSSSNFIFPGRVRHIILDETSNNQLFQKHGGWSSIGTIFFTLMDAPNTDSDPTTSQFAKPLFPNQKLYPLLNEVVYLISLPDSEVEENVNSKTFYYFQPVNLWSSNHHNAIPDPILGSSLPSSQQQDYQQVETGNVRRVTDGGTEIDLGKTFKEKPNIKTLQPYEGDVIYEGRWGQSFRFGSTVKNSTILSPWSKTGQNGDPITILRNDQFDDGNDPWVPQLEDINKEGSSVYLTSTQAIPIDVSSKSYKSYSIEPTTPDKFTDEQIILNSGRLLFNSKTDSILFSSAKSINLNAVDSVNVDAPKTILQSDEVLLGDKNATESIILGDKFLDDLSKLLTSIIQLGNALQTPIGTGTPGVINATIPVPATNVVQNSNQMLNKIQTYKSKVSKSK